VKNQSLAMPSDASRPAKERPILFSAPMVRALLSGAKTQTRRAMKPQPIQGGPLRDGWHWSKGAWNFPIDERVSSARVLAEVCPYGQPGDRLWVKETYIYLTPLGLYGYRAGPDLFVSPRWKSPLFMPRQASRITLEVTGIRVERLQDISEEDARAEGIARTASVGPCRAMGWRGFDGAPAHMRGAAAYRDLWESINGPDSWAANPWVWVVEFKRLEQGVE